VLTLESGFDWMEWQASYAAAALLMPKSRLHLTVAAYFRGREMRQLPSDSREATDLEQLVGEAFEVSVDAARVRLSQLGYLAA
jgi:Zn-dependent peptidase ImmA (M78 family)